MAAQVDMAAFLATTRQPGVIHRVAPRTVLYDVHSSMHAPPRVALAAGGAACVLPVLCPGGGACYNSSRNLIIVQELFPATLLAGQLWITAEVLLVEGRPSSLTV